MNKEERQERHQLRLKLKKERDEKAAEYQSYYWRFYEETMRLLRELPERSYKHSHSLSFSQTRIIKDPGAG